MNEMLWIAQNIMGVVIGFCLFIILVLVTMICVIKFKELLNQN